MNASKGPIPFVNKVCMKNFQHKDCNFSCRPANDQVLVVPVSWYRPVSKEEAEAYAPEAAIEMINSGSKISRTLNISNHG